MVESAENNKVLLDYDMNDEIDNQNIYPMPETATDWE